MTNSIFSLFLSKKKEHSAEAQSTTSQKYNKIKSFVMKRPWLVVAIGVLAVVLMSTRLRSIAALLALVAGATLSKLPQAIFPVVVVLDLIMFLLVVATMAYGPFIGISLALIAYYVGTILRAQFSNVASETYAGPPMGIVISGILCSFLPFGVVATGMTTVVFYSIIMLIFYRQIYPGNIMNELTFLVTILPFNYWLFTSFGERMLAMLGA
jgi:hypothetical protein